jgi:hypothetical protein
MPEIKPKLSFSENTLEISKLVPPPMSSFERLKAIRESCEQFSMDQGYEAELNDKEMTLRANIPEVLSAKSKGFFENNVVNLLKTIQFFTTYSSKNETIDNVFSLRVSNPVGSVSAQFQRWLNANLIDEDIAKDTIRAMALPFGEHEVVDALKKFSFQAKGNDMQVGTGDDEGHFTLTSRRLPSELVIVKALHDKNLRGSVAWNYLELGSFNALFGVDVEKIRSKSEIPKGRVNQLYDMYCYDLEFNLQRLSLILGVGVLANKAAQYTGGEDIYAEADWKEFPWLRRETNTLKSL